MVEQSQITLSTIIVKPMFNSDRRKFLHLQTTMNHQLILLESTCRSPLGGAASLPSPSGKSSTNSPEARYIGLATTSVRKYL